MRVISLLIISLLLSQFAWANEATLNTRIQKYKLLQAKVMENCIEGKNAANYKVKIDDQTYTCAQLIIITNRLGKELETDVEKFKDTCESDANSDQKKLAAQVAAVTDKTASCTPSPDQKQCFSKFACGMAVAAVPAMSLVASAGIFDSTALKTCTEQSKTMPGCLMNVMRGIFDSIWSALELVWDVGKYLTTKTGELLGIIKVSEAETSERAMMAQQAGPGFLKRFASDPGGTIKELAKSFYDSLEAAAINHYGCEKWSGLPFASTCLKPMENWECGSCQQKAQVYCGIAGYAVGEIGTALLTGGLAAGGKVALTGALKLASGPAKNVASFMGKTFPKSAVEIEKMAGKVKTMAQAGFTASQAALFSAWEGVKASKATKAIAKAASSVPLMAAGKAATVALKPITAYLKAMDKAFMVGFEATETALKGGKQVVSQKAMAGAKIADAAMEADPKNAISPGLVVADKKAPVPSAPKTTTTNVGPAQSNLVVRTPTAVSTQSKATQTEVKAATAADKALDDEAAKMIQDTKNLPDLMLKYRQDPEYADLFKAQKAYPEQDRDIALIIADMEKSKMSKSEIRLAVEKFLNSCGI